MLAKFRKRLKLKYLYTHIDKIEELWQVDFNYRHKHVAFEK